MRGGGADQNLLILDEAPVYNATHLFGFLSVFNADALKSVRVQKGAFSAQYGGRLSSVVEMTMREGNRKRFGGEAGTGLVASRLLVEGPLLGQKASLILTARRSNLDPLLGRFVAGLVNAYSGANWRANFYDLNAKAVADMVEMLAGRYEDILIREDGKWKFLRRVDTPVMPTSEEWREFIRARAAARAPAASPSCSGSRSSRSKRPTSRRQKRSSAASPLATRSTTTCASVKARRGRCTACSPSTKIASRRLRQIPFSICATGIFSSRSSRTFSA